MFSLELPGVVSLHAFTPPDKGLNMLRFLAPKKNGLAEWWEWYDFFKKFFFKYKYNYYIFVLLYLCGCL